MTTDMWHYLCQKFDVGSAYGAVVHFLTKIKDAPRRWKPNLGSSTRLSIKRRFPSQRDSQASQPLAFFYIIILNKQLDKQLSVGHLRRNGARIHFIMYTIPANFWLLEGCVVVSNSGNVPLVSNDEFVNAILQMNLPQSFQEMGQGYVFHPAFFWGYPVQVDWGIQPLTAAVFGYSTHLGPLRSPLCLKYRVENRRMGRQRIDRPHHRVIDRPYHHP